MILNSSPIRPSGVQLTRPMRPPGRQTPASSWATTSWRGANCTPKADSDAVEGLVLVGQLLGVALDPVDGDAGGGGARRAPSRTARG